MLITWKDGSAFPWCAIYDCASLQFLIPPKQISATVTVASDIYACYNPFNNTFFIPWINNITNTGSYVIFDCASNTITTPATLDTQLFQDLIPLFNPNNNTIFLTTNNGTYPCYAIFDPSELSITPFIAIPGSADIYNNLNCCYLARQKHIFMTWTNSARNGAYYAIYDTVGNLFTTQATLIPNSSSTIITGDVIPCYDPTNNAVLMRWDNSQGPTYAIYDIKKNTFKEPSSPIPNAAAYGAFFNVQPVFNSKLKNVFISWTTDAQNTAAFTSYMFKSHAIKKATYSSPVIYQKGT